MALRLILLQAFVCSSVLAAYQHRFNDPQPVTIFVSKADKNGSPAHRLTETRMYSNSEWEQISGENKGMSEISFFTAYTRQFHVKDIGGYFNSKEVGGFTKKMRVCKLQDRYGNSYLITSKECERYAAANRIGEEFNFYVSSEHRREHDTRKIYYASCQDRESNFAFIKISVTGSARCGDNSMRINHGTFYAYVPGVACSDVDASHGTHIQYMYNEGRISAASATCSSGYTLTGSAQVTCSTTGRWSSTVPTCQAVQCGTPYITDPNMVMNSEGPFGFDDWVEFSCLEGFQIYPDRASAHCNHAGNWIMPHAVCKPVDCRYPGDPDHGSTEAEDGYELGSEIEFKCESGYRLEGASGAVCMSNGEWSNRLPTCIVVRCPDLVPLVHGIHTGSPSRYVMGQAVTFQCNMGYSLVGESSRLTCKLNRETDQGEWSSEPPVCSKIMCTPPAAPENGQIFGTDYSFGAQISFQCNTGFMPQQSTVATCLKNGQWDATAPKCHAMQCRDPGTPEHCTRDGSTFTYGSVLTYQCDVGYLRQGSRSIVCNENGRWTGSPPTCEPIGCDEIAAPESGSKESESFVYGSFVNFSCFPGYQMQGSNKTQCLSNGQWSEEVPLCTPCALGFYKSEAGSGSCIECPERSYTTSEASNSKQQCICEHDTFGPPGGPCKAVECSLPAAPEYGSIVECGTENNDRCLFSCDAGFILQGTRNRRCTPQGWAGHMPVCVACPENTYKREEGSLSCTPCPQNTYIPAGVLGTSQDMCQCRPGFEYGATGECEDINECMLSNGGCEDVCENTPGSYTCKCTIGGYELSQDKHKCNRVQTCTPLQDTVSNGYTTCKYYNQTNGYTCGIKCNAGFFFVSGTNNYVTCGVETEFEWSHKLINRTATLPSCTEEFYVDVQLPVKSMYTSPFSCNSLQFDPSFLFEKMHVQKAISTLLQCTDSSASGRFCEVKNLDLECEDLPNANSEEVASLTVSFEVLLRNKEEGAVHPSCDDTCKRQSLREMLGNAWNLTKELEKLVMKKPIGVEVQDEVYDISPEKFEWDRPKLLCEEPGRVLTKYRLCVPCDRGYYLPQRDLESCLPCPKGQYQDEQAQTTCKKCLPSTTTLTDGTPHPAMCSVRISEYAVNTTISENELKNEDDDEDEIDSIVMAMF